MINPDQLLRKYRLDDEATLVVRSCVGVANDHIGTEHILYGLLGYASVRKIIEAMGLDPNDLRTKTLEYIQADPNHPETVGGFTQTASKVFDLAEEERQRLALETVTAANIFVGMLAGEVGMGLLLILGDKDPVGSGKRLVAKQLITEQVRKQMASEK